MSYGERQNEAAGTYYSVVRSTHMHTVGSLYGPIIYKYSHPRLSAGTHNRNLTVRQVVLVEQHYHRQLIRT